MSSRPWGMGMHRCRMPNATRLYSSPPITVNDLAFLAMRLAWVRSGGRSPRSIHARYLARQSSARGTGSVSMASASFAPYPSSSESTKASFGGSSSMGSAPAGLEGAPKGSSWCERAGVRSTVGLAMSHAKMFRRAVIRPDAIFASSPTSLLYCEGCD
jgi:hypothetical protein